MTLKRYILFAAFSLPALASFAQDYNNIEFVENKGQWDKRVKFKGNVSSGAFFIRSTGFTVLQHDPNDLQAYYEMVHGHKSAGKGNLLHSHSYWVDFVGASPDMEVVPDKIISSYNNYFIGNDPSKWAGGCRIYQAITLKNVYDKVDVRYYTDNGSLKYDIIAHPGANISKIALQYRGVDKMQVKNKELNVSTSIGELQETLPYSYQSDGKQKSELSCKYVLKDNIIRFDVKNYDPTATLIIDPSLIFCSFIGSKANMWGFTATYGPDGSAYGGGIVFDNDVFPVTPGAFQMNFQGGNTSGVSNAPIDIGIMKLSSNGTNRIYATYLGGNGNEQPHSLVVDAQGNLVVAGRSNSTNYPGGLIGPCGDWDITVTKFNSTGTAIIGSQRIGGRGMDGANITAGSDGVSSLQENYGDDGRSEVILDGSGNIYVASCTQSLDFPTPNGFQTSFGGGLQDGALIKLNANASAAIFCSYLGGGGNDAAYVLSLGATGDIYVGGGTESSNFPGDHTGTIYPSNQGGIDGFLARVTNNGSAIIKSTYLGTPGSDQVYGVQFDKNGFPYVMGQTTGAWKVINAAYVNAGSKQFISKLQPDLSNWVYSTVFGTGSAIPNISPVAFLVDRCENVYVSGWGGLIVPSQPSYYPSAGTSGMPTTPDAIKLNSPDNADFYFFVLKKDATSQLYGSFFGQDGGAVLDHVDGGTSRFDQTGVIYQAICANCGGGANFPTTPGAWSTSRPPSAYCNLAVVKIAFNLAGVASGVTSAINGVPRDTAGCVPLTVDFTDTVRNAVSYEWNFGDGTPTLATANANVTHTYNFIGNYQVMLVAIDPNTCNVRDTSYLHIRVGDVIGTLGMNIVKLLPCDSFKYRFDNLSTAPAIRPYGAQSFRWDFGDGSPRITAGTASV
ncbi:MAG TPA: PKD domain-containing protein, partial [Chitinophagaceae bacterium]|nr:PKD domain-containing protein [Chitinophagaceae bacterium]